MKQTNDDSMTFGGHLEVLRQMLLRIIAVTAVLAAVVFCFKDETWAMLLAPSQCDFCTYRWIERAMHLAGASDFHFAPYHIDLIVTELSAQFMMHITTSIYLALLAASPYILYELFRFISPALYESERRYSVQTTVVIYLLFILGVLMTYYILFPISFRFLGTYSVSQQIHSSITLDSYIDTFVSLTLMMGIVFQLPVIAFALSKMGIVNSHLLSHYRKHAFLLLMVISAIITPPDIMTLILVTIPLYLLFELSINVVRWTERGK